MQYDQIECKCGMLPAVSQSIIFSMALMFLRKRNEAIAMTRCGAGSAKGKETAFVISFKNKQHLGTCTGLLLALFAMPSLFAQRASEAPGASVSTAEVGAYPQPRVQTQTLPRIKLPYWISLDGELRSRTENQTAINLLPGEDHTYELIRVRGAMDVHPVSWANLYVQFHDLHALGLPLQYTAANMRDNFDFRQVYIRFHLKNLQILAGRQLLNFGNERVIGISDWTQTSRSFDGFDVRIGNAANHVDLFSASVVTIYPTSLDMHVGGLNYHGVYASFGGLLPRTTIEPFVLIKAMPHVTSRHGTTGSELEATSGLRVQGNPGLGFDSDVTGTLQRGSYSSDSIHAGSLIAKGGWMASRAPWKPHMQAEYDYASGNTLRDLDRVNTFDQQYPSNHNAFGLVDLFGFQNIKQNRVNLDVTPVTKFTMLFQVESLHTASVHDAVYKSTGTPLVNAPEGGFATDRIGTGFDASARCLVAKYLLAQIGVGHFFPGEIMTHGGKGAPLTITWLQFTYRFKMP